MGRGGGGWDEGEEDEEDEVAYLHDERVGLQEQEASL